MIVLDRCPCRSARANSWACAAPTAPARRPCCDCWRIRTGPTAALDAGRGAARTFLRWSTRTRSLPASGRHDCRDPDVPIPTRHSTCSDATVMVALHRDGSGPDAHRAVRLSQHRRWFLVGRVVRSEHRGRGGDGVAGLGRVQVGLWRMATMAVVDQVLPDVAAEQAANTAVHGHRIGGRDDVDPSPHPRWALAVAEAGGRAVPSDRPP